MLVLGSVTPLIDKGYNPSYPFTRPFRRAPTKKIATQGVCGLNGPAIIVTAAPSTTFAASYDCNSFFFLLVRTEGRELRKNPVKGSDEPSGLDQIFVERWENSQRFWGFKPWFWIKFSIVGGDQPPCLEGSRIIPKRSPASRIARKIEFKSFWNV